MKTNKRLFVIFAAIIFSATLFAQLQPNFKIGMLDVGIHGLDNTDFIAHNPDGNKLFLSSTISGCISIFKIDMGSGEWDCFQSAFLEDFNLSSPMFMPLSFSPAGENLYTLCYNQENKQSICNFTFDETTDSLQFNSIVSNYTSNQVGSLTYIEVSQNGKFVYGVSGTHIFHFNRDQATGDLTFNAYTDLVDYDTYYLRVSPDSKNLYVVAEDSYIKNFQIDETSGDLNLIQTIEYTFENNYLGLYNPNDFDIDPLGEYIYVASNELSVFSRNQDDGILTFTANQENLGLPDVINSTIRAITTIYVDKLNNQQVHLYSQRDGWILMDKNPELDTLSYNSIIEQEIPGSWFQHKKLLSIDTSVFITFNGDNSLKRYLHQADDSYILTQKFLAYEYALDRPTSLLFTPDEDKLYVLARFGLTMFERQLTNGKLEFNGSVRIPGNMEASSFCINNSGSHIYVINQKALTYKTFEDNQLPELIQDGGNFDIDQNLVKISPDNKNLYTTADNFQRGFLTYNIDNDGLISISDTLNTEEKIADFCISSDGRFLYSVSTWDHNLMVYSRDIETGLLTHLQEIDGSEFGNGILAYAVKIVLSKDENFVYTGSNERTIGLLERDSVSGLLYMIGPAGSNITNRTYRLHTITQSNDDKYMYITHTWWDDALIIFSKDNETGEIKELITFDENDPNINIKGSRQLLNDKKDRFLYATGWNFLSGYTIEPIMEDTIKSPPGELVQVYANPYYEEYNWSVSSLNQNSIMTDQNGWIYLNVKDELDILRYDSVFIDNNSSIFNYPKNIVELSIYPNPTINSINVSGSSALKKVNIRIFSMEGKLLKTKLLTPGDEPFHLDVSDLTDGTYILQAYDLETSEFIGKSYFIKQ